MELRPYQNETVKKTVKYVLLKKNVLYILPTGGGKTFIFTNIVKQLKALNKSILVVVHRKELLKQAYDDLLEIGVLSSIIHDRKKVQKQVSVAMAKTLQNTNITADVMIFDEAHRGEFDAFFTEERYKKAVKIGCTATPIKNFTESNLPFTQMYDEYIEEADIRFLLRKKYLCNVINISFKIHSESEKPSGVDFAEPETIANVLAEVEKFEREKGRGKTLFFTANQNIAKAYVKAFEEKGIKALFVTSETKQKERDRRLALYHDLKSGYDYMFSCDILLTGYNFPEISRIAWLRCTSSLIVWLQGNGRGSRTTKKIYKRFYYCLDFGYNLQRLGSWDANHDMHKHYSRMPEDNQDELVTLYVCQSCFASYTESLDKCLECGEKMESEDSKGGARMGKDAEVLAFEPENVLKRFRVLRKENDLYESIKAVYLEFGRTSLFEIFTELPDSAKEGKVWAYDPEAFLEAFEDYYL